MFGIACQLGDPLTSLDFAHAANGRIEGPQRSV